jgi:hypothetical protein
VPGVAVEDDEGTGGGFHGYGGAVVGDFAGHWRLPR